MRPSRGRVALGLGLALVVLGLGGLIATHAWLEHTLLRGHFDVDPTTGLVRLATSLERGAVSRADQLHWAYHWPLIQVAMLGLGLCAVGLIRRGGRLVWVTAPIWLPALVVLAFATLTLSENDLAALTPGPHHWFGGCIQRLDPCSRVRALELVRGGCLVVLCLTTLALIPAGRRAWRLGLGENARRLSPGWSRAARACLILGALALIWTRAHRHDRLDVAERCAATDWRRITPVNEVFSSDNWLVASVSAASPELRAIEVPIADCTTLEWGPPEYQLFADGTLTVISYPSEPDLRTRSSREVDIDAALRRDVAIDDERANMLGEEAPAVHEVRVIVDERVQIHHLEAWFARFADAGHNRVLIYGASEREDGLLTTGPWRQRHACQLTSYDLDRDPGLPERFVDLVSPSYRFRVIADALRERD